MNARPVVQEPSWRGLTDQIARIRTCLADLGRAIARGEDDARLSSPIFHQLVENAAQCLESSLRRVDPSFQPAPSQEASRPPVALAGNTGAVSVGELLHFLSNLHRSGTLAIRTPSELFHLRLESGAIVYATGDNNPAAMRIGEILVRRRAISAHRLRRFLHDEHDGRRFLGEALVTAGLVKPEDLRSALVYQIQQIFARVHESPFAEFEFRDSREEEVDLGLRLNVTQLLLEVARRSDEAGRAKPDAAA